MYAGSDTNTHKQIQGLDVCLIWEHVAKPLRLLKSMTIQANKHFARGVKSKGLDVCWFWHKCRDWMYAGSENRSWNKNVVSNTRELMYAGSDTKCRDWMYAGSDHKTWRQNVVSKARDWMYAGSDINVGTGCMLDLNINRKGRTRCQKQGSGYILVLTKL